MVLPLAADSLSCYNITKGALSPAHLNWEQTQGAGFAPAGKEENNYELRQRADRPQAHPLGAVSE